MEKRQNKASRRFAIMLEIEAARSCFIDAPWLPFTLTWAWPDDENAAFPVQNGLLWIQNGADRAES
jgi:hypothetical protein